MTDRPPLDLTALVGILRRRKWLILGTATLAAALAFGLSSLQAERYEAVASLLFRQAEPPPRIDPDEPPPDLANSPERVAATNLALASLETVTARARRRLNSPLSVEELRGKVDLEPAGQADIVEVRASAGTPEAASLRANVFAEEVVRFRAERAQEGVQRVIDAIRGQLSSVPPRGSLARRLSERAEQLEVEKRLESGDVEIAEEAVPPLDPAAPKPVRNTLIGGVLGLLLGGLLAVVLQRFDRRLEDEPELAELVGAPIVGRIPVERDSGWEGELFREAYQFLRANLELGLRGERQQVLAVTGAAPGVGKSSVVARLAEAFALSGSRVIAVDCDLRKPRLHEYFNVSGEGGVMDVVVAGRDAGLLHETADELLQDTSEGVKVLTAGPFLPATAPAISSAGALKEVITGFRLKADHVLLDTAPVTIGALTSVVAADADGVLLVVDLNDVDRDILTAAVEQLRTAGARIVGVVLNRAPVLLPAEDYRGYYSSGIESGVYRPAQDKNGRRRRGVGQLRATARKDDS